MYNKAYVEITNVCNMSCSFCHGHKRAPRRMSKEELALVLDRLNGVTEYVYYHLMGEPLTHPDLPEFIKMARERGFKPIITTNGTLLPKREDEILSSGVYKVNISLHSFENGSGSELKKYIVPLAEFAKKAANTGIITVFRLWNKGFDGGKNEIAFSVLRDHISGEWAENTRGIRIRSKLHLEWGDRFEWPDENAEIKGEKCFCYGLKDQFGVLSDGTVVPCCLDSDGVISLGNIFNEDIESILASERAKHISECFARGIACEELCKRCGYAQRFV